MTHQDPNLAHLHQLTNPNLSRPRQLTKVNSDSIISNLRSSAKQPEHGLEQQQQNEQLRSSERVPKDDSDQNRQDTHARYMYMYGRRLKVPAKFKDYKL